VLRAAKLLKQYSGTPLGIDIQVNKKIPIGGGLGGGSSDAATTLLALNQLWQLQLPLTTLATLGLQLGADVPIFIYGRAAWAEGVGEILTPVTNLAEPWYLIIYPQCQVSTAQIFSAPALTRNHLPVTMTDFQARRCTNVCEPIVRQYYPPVADALDWLNQYGEARLTGTGSCVFAAFSNSIAAQTVLEKLPKQWQAFVAQGKNKSPAYDLFTSD
jgi:4-diphosphocytidyl-2-C-methyl-D-erythritol kinase